MKNENLPLEQLAMCLSEGGIVHYKSSDFCFILFCRGVGLEKDHVYLLLHLSPEQLAMCLGQGGIVHYKSAAFLFCFVL